MAINDVDPTTLILRVADVLEKEKLVDAPVWSQFAKSGVSRDRPPAQANWWYIRSAAILRKLYLKGPIGTEKLRTYFGGLKNRGVKPEHFFAAGGNHIRKILQQLEKSGLAKKTEVHGYKGRIITPKGQQLLESVASQFAKPLPKAQPKAVEPKAEKSEAEPKKKRVTKKKAKEDGKE